MKCLLCKKETRSPWLCSDCYRDGILWAAKQANRERESIFPSLAIVFGEKTSVWNEFPKKNTKVDQKNPFYGK